MKDPDLWSIFASLERPHSLVIYSCFAWFMGNYAIASADTLLGLSFLHDGHTDFAEFRAMNKWLPQREFDESHLFQLPDAMKFLDQDHRDRFIYSVNDCSETVKRMVWPPFEQKPDRDLVLGTVRSILRAFDWTKVSITDSDDIQYKVYAVLASFVYALLRLIEVLPVIEVPPVREGGKMISYNASFLLSEFFPALRLAVETGGMRTKREAFSLLGDLVCRPSSVALLGRKLLSNWHGLLAELAQSEDDKLAKLAVRFAGRTLILGFGGSSRLLGVLAGAPTARSRVAFPMTMRSDAEIVSVILAVNTLAPIYNVDVHNGVIEALTALRPPLRVPAIIACVIEEAMAGRNKIATTGVELLAAEIARIAKAEDIYAFLPLTLVLPELESAVAGAVSRILAAVIEKLERLLVPHDFAFVTLLEFAVDLMVLTTEVIEWREHYQRFQEVAGSWKSKGFTGDDALHVKEQLALLTHFIMTYPAPVMEAPLSTEKTAVFGVTDEQILHVGVDTLISRCPVGQYEWKFRSIATEAPPFTFDDDVNIEHGVLKEDDCVQQTAFVSPINDFFSKLGECDASARLYRPQDFEQKGLTLSQNRPVPPTPQRAPPSSVGSQAIAFMSSLDYCDGLMPSQLSPRSQGAPADEQLSRPYFHTIDVSFVAGASSHFEDFKTGLGFIDGARNAIVFPGVQHEIVFHRGQCVHSIMIVWIDGLSPKAYLESFGPPNQIRIEIQSQPSGLFLVHFRITRELPRGFPCFGEILVSKRALPVFVIGQILSLAHLREFGLNIVQKPLNKSATHLQKYRRANFYSHSVLLQCARELLSLDTRG
jgi:hypothetical protein